MKPIRRLVIAALLLFATTFTAWSHSFTVTIWDYWGIPEGETNIQVSDGIEWFQAPLIAIEGDPTGEYDENGNEILANLRNIYAATVPDLWATESRGLSFHLPGHGLTTFYPAIAAGETYHIDLGFTRRTSPNPNANFTAVGNRVMLGQWWAQPGVTLPPSVAKLFAWDNTNPYWPCVGVDNIASTGHAFWRWMHPEGEADVVAMELDHLHRLTLRGRTNPGNTLMLDPEMGRITVNGMPFVTAANAAAQLSSALSPAFVSRSAAGVNLALGGGTLRAGAGLPPQVLLGGANDARTNDNGTDHTQGVLIVGSATTPGTNGLRILDDGTLLILPKGDLSMGVFEVGPKP